MESNKIRHIKIMTTWERIKLKHYLYSSELFTARWIDGLPLRFFHFTYMFVCWYLLRVWQQYALVIYLIIGVKDARPDEFIRKPIVNLLS